jgi:RNA polymerase sigma-70 factor (ECF subfamily)
MVAQVVETSRFELHIQPTGGIGIPTAVALSDFPHHHPVRWDTEHPLQDQSTPCTPSFSRHLVESARLGCPTAFAELWGVHSRRLYLTIFKIVRNPVDAEDALQDCFVLAFTAVNRFEGRSNFYTWLTRIAINSALSMLRRRRRRPEMSLPKEEHWPDEFRDVAPGPEQLLDQKQRHATLMRAMHRLPTRLQDVVQILLIEDCTVRQAACRLNISYAAAKSRLHRARAMIHSISHAEDPDTAFRPFRKPVRSQKPRYATTSIS